MSTHKDNSTVIDSIVCKSSWGGVSYLRHIIFLTHLLPYHYQCNVGLHEF